LKRRIEKRNARDAEELKRFVSEEWTATDPSFLAKLVESMPERLEAVISLWWSQDSSSFIFLSHLLREREKKNN